ncbi:MAG: 16S rRNA (adenine(1518)-N(6)/adenine(1519)-N(6))-dimethyltransferase RsmA [Gammaproteobacteria bacterium]
MARPLRKRFGQHFLRDPAVIERIVQVIAPLPEQLLVEIGPGDGAITAPLLQRCGRLTVIELDRDLPAPLRQRCGAMGDLTIIQNDALKMDYCELAEQHRSIRVVGNLPYNISTPLLFHMISQADCFLDMHFMLQLEVVNRMAAVPGNKDYGRLSVMIQYHCQVIPLFSIPPDAFHPPPRVQSAFVRLLPYADPPVALDDPSLFRKLVKQAFSQRRKTLRNSLMGLLSEPQFTACGVDPAMRPEQLTLQQFAALANAVDRLN